jgi:hypothetical protein
MSVETLPGYDAWKTRVEEDRPEGDCPTCGGVTDNGEKDADEDGYFWRWLDCDCCAAKCANCGETGVKHDEGKRCVNCAEQDALAQIFREESEESAYLVHSMMVFLKDKYTWQGQTNEPWARNEQDVLDAFKLLDRIAEKLGVKK